MPPWALRATWPMKIDIFSTIWRTARKRSVSTISRMLPRARDSRFSEMERMRRCRRTVCSMRCKVTSSTTGATGRERNSSARPRYSEMIVSTRSRVATRIWTVVSRSRMLSTSSDAPWVAVLTITHGGRRLSNSRRPSTPLRAETTRYPKASRDGASVSP